MASEKIIVFGPTGQVAAAAAIVAQENGVQVSLAMRDTTKSIPGLSPEQEQNAGFERVYADLTKPETIRAAVEKTGAKRAFLYCMFRTPMRASIEALKAAGIEFVVFNSSSSVAGDLRSIPQTDYIAWQHAQVEIALEEVFGVPNYMAVRPGAFASNVFSWKSMVQSGELKMVYPDAVFSYVAPEDIGRVCGRLLVAGPQVLETASGRNVVTLTGPELVSQREAAEGISKAIGKDISIVALDDDDGVKFFMNAFDLPESGAKGFVDNLKDMAQHGRSHERYQGPVYKEAIGNVQKYTGKPSTTLFQWLQNHKEAFAA